jgi:predicted Zn-dependent protease
MGHVLGLGHSKNPEDVMSPWYNASLKALTQNDIDRAKMNCKTPFNLGGGGKSEEKKTT